MNHRYKEGTSVILKEDHPLLGLQAGARGKVWFLYETELPSYEITFSTQGGEEFDAVMTEEEMEKVLTRFQSFEEADRADKEYYRRLTPLERLEILLDLNRRWPQTQDHDTASPQLQRVYRIVKRSSG